MIDISPLPYQHIIAELDRNIAIVKMNRPEKRNVLSLDQMQELNDCFLKIGQRQDITVAILKSEGPVFSAGHDIHEMVGQDINFYRRLFDVSTQLMNTIQTIPQPVIAEVAGIATAAGCQLVAACDLAVASEEAKFATPGVKIGLFCSTPMVALSRAVGRKKALEMLLTGEPISAEMAVQIGLINKVVPMERLEEETMALAQKIASSSRFTIGIGKQAFYRQLEMPQDAAYAYTKEVMSLNAAALDAQEGMSAFLDKRTPVWQGR